MAAPVKARILLIEGKRADRVSYAAGLTKKGFQVESAPNGNAALRMMKDRLPHLVLIDAVSLRTSGRRICQSIRQHAAGVAIVLMVDEGFNNLQKLDADIVLSYPFTLQKLLNRIRPLLPVEQKSLLQAGPIQLDVEQRLMRCKNRLVSLTPRLVVLLQALMEHPGVVIERKKLFRKVWDTAYTGDTRTLDVHVSWLRQALEEDPRHPEFIKTVRGVGYRLDV